MRRTVQKSLLLFSLITTLGCTVFSAGPYVLEFRYDPSPTPTPLPSVTPTAPAPTPLPPPGGADLTVSDLTINTPDGQPACDRDTPISLMITNSGSAASIETGVRVLQVGPSRLQLFSEASVVVPSLAPGTAHPVTVSLPLYTTPNSVYTIFGIVDQGNTNNEVNESDNQQSLVITVTCGAAPNLRITVLEFTEVNCIGETTVRFTVNNLGDAHSPQSTLYIDVLDSTVPTITNVPALPPGAAYSGIVNLILYQLPDGNYRLRARADVSMSIVEGDENDNITDIPLVVTCETGATPAATSGVRPTAEVFPTATVDVNSADLVVTALTAIDTGVNPRCGENTRVDFTVENRGVSGAAANVIHIADYNDFVITSDAYYGIPPLQPGENYSGSVNIVVGRPANVVHMLQAYVDSEFTVVEFNETNNVMSISYNVDDNGSCD